MRFIACLRGGGGLGQTTRKNSESGGFHIFYIYRWSHNWGQVPCQLVVFSPHKSLSNLPPHASFPTMVLAYSLFPMRCETGWEVRLPSDGARHVKTNAAIKSYS